MEGQINLKDAVRRNISFRDPKSGKTYQLKQQARPLPLAQCRKYVSLGRFPLPHISK